MAKQGTLPLVEEIPKARQRSREPEMGLGGSGGMDGTHAGDPGKRGERRPNAYFIEQGCLP